MALDLIQSSGSTRSRLPPSFGNYDNIRKLTYEGRLLEALHSLDLMVQRKSEAPEGCFVCIVRACTRRKALTEGKQVHALISKTKGHENVLLSNLLIGMYSACGSVADALKVFCAMPRHNVFSWTAMISAYAEGKQYKEAVSLFQQMRQAGVELDEIICVVALKSCAKIGDLAQGRHLHSLILKKGFDSNINVQTALVNLYAKCGRLKHAQKLFDNMIQRNVVSWTAMIAGYAQEGLGNEALDMYHQMKFEGMEPDNVTLVILLKACAGISALQQGKQLHSLICQKGLESQSIVQTALVDMYSKCGCLKDAREIFDSMTKEDAVSWNAMIAGYVQEGLGEKALDLYEQMQRVGMEPDSITLVLLLKACASISALQQGKQFHSLILEKGFELELIVRNTLLDMYSKCGCHEYARKLFDNMDRRDVVSWNAMIAGYTQEGLGKEALDLYEQMKCQGMEPDSVTIVLLLKACTSNSALQQGKQLHSLILEKGFESQLSIQNTLIDMYSKCGCLNDARELFDNMAERDLVSWTAMIQCYAVEGLGKEALHLFQQMKDEGLQANDITYACVLSACCHSGLVDKGRYVFESLSKDYAVTPTLTHYACMVDLLGRAGCLSDAEDLILKMPIPPNKIVWVSLLGAARKYADMEIGRRAFEHCVKLEPENAAPYLLLLDIYLSAGRMDEVAELRKEMKDKCLEKASRQMS